MMANTKERNEQATPISSGYTLDLYCCECLELGALRDEGGYEPLQVIATEGKNCYSMARRLARKYGWTLHKDGYATCPECNKKNK